MGSGAFDLVWPTGRHFFDGWNWWSWLEIMLEGLVEEGWQVTLSRQNLGEGFSLVPVIGYPLRRFNYALHLHKRTCLLWRRERKRALDWWRSAWAHSVLTRRSLFFFASGLLDLVKFILWQVFMFFFFFLLFKGPSLPGAPLLSFNFHGILRGLISSFFALHLEGLCHCTGDAKVGQGERKLFSGDSQCHIINIFIFEVVVHDPSFNSLFLVTWHLYFWL